MLPQCVVIVVDVVSHKKMPRQNVNELWFAVESIYNGNKQWPKGNKNVCMKDFCVCALTSCVQNYVHYNATIFLSNAFLYIGG